MMNNDMNEPAFMKGYALGKSDDEQNMADFTWAWSLLMLFVAHAGPAPKIESFDDFKKAIQDFSDRIQEMELPDLEVPADED